MCWCFHPAFNLKGFRCTWKCGDVVSVRYKIHRALPFSYLNMIYIHDYTTKNVQNNKETYLYIRTGVTWKWSSCQQIPSCFCTRVPFKKSYKWFCSLRYPWDTSEQYFAAAAMSARPSYWFRNVVYNAVYSIRAQCANHFDHLWFLPKLATNHTVNLAKRHTDTCLRKTEK